jgi:hypothetical protein
VEGVTDLKLYLERAIRKLDEEPDPQDASSDLHGLANWVRVQSQLFRQKRDMETKSSETYRFFDGKSDGFESVLRFLEEQAGTPARRVENPGYLSGRDAVPKDPATHQTAMMNLQDTGYNAGTARVVVSEQRLCEL